MNMSIPLIAAGMFFIINPVITIIDVIPDFIGYIMIVMGLDKPADMEDHFASAKRSFIILTVLSGIKTVCCALLGIIDGTFIILLSFVFAVGEAICFVSGVINIFGGFHYYGLRLESDPCYGIYKYVKRKDENGEKVRVWARVRTSDSVMIFSVIVFIIRELCAFLPQMPIIFRTRSSEIIGSEYAVDWTYFIPHFYVLASVVVLAVSIPWAVSFAKYIMGISRDEKLMGTLCKNYEENILPNEGYFAEKKTLAVKIFTVIGAVFCFSIYMDYVNWLPGGVAGVMFAIAAIMLRKTSKAALPTAIMGFLTVIPSALEVIFQYQYKEMKYTYETFANGMGKSTVMYPRIIIAEIIGAVLLIITIWLYAKCLRDMTASHCMLYEKALPETRSGKGVELCQRISKAYKVAFILMSVMCLASALHGTMAVYYPEFWLVNFFIGAFMVVFLLRAGNLASDELYDKLRDKY